MSMRDLLSVADVARDIGVSVRYVQALAHAGRLRAERIGRAYVIRRADVESIRHRRPRGRPPRIKPGGAAWI